MPSVDVVLLLPRSHCSHTQGEVWKALIEKYGRAFFWSGVLKVRYRPACHMGDQSA